MQVLDFAQDAAVVFDKIKVCYNSNDTDVKAIYVHYTSNQNNMAYFNINAGTYRITPYNFVTDSLPWQNTIEYKLGTRGLYINEQIVANKSYSTFSYSTFYGSNTYSSGYVLMAHYSYSVNTSSAVNRDATMSGELFCSQAQGSNYSRFLVQYNFIVGIRLNSLNTVDPKFFRIVAKDGNSLNPHNLIKATYKINLANPRRIDIYIYFIINGTYNRCHCFVDHLFSGDVYPIAGIPNDNLEMPASYVASIPSDQTEIT